MKSILLSLSLIFTFNLVLKAQSLLYKDESITLQNVKQLNKNNPNCFFVDANKVIEIPINGGFLYSSNDNTENTILSGYNNNENFTVTIKNPYGRKLFLKPSYFLTDKNDVLKIYDGKDVSAPLIRTYSGNLETSDLILSSGEYLTLHFKSDFQITSKGFRFRLDNGPALSASAAPLPNPQACASTPASDECSVAPLICDLSGYCGNTSGAYSAGNTSGLGGFCGSIENNSWLSFIASTTVASLVFTSSSCQDNSSGIQATIYASTNCSSYTQVANCESQGSSSGTFTITTNVNLVPGQTYYVMVDGFGGNVCNYSVTAQSGVALTPQISGPNEVCPGNSLNLSSSVPASSYTWTSNPPGTYPNTQTISVTPSVTTTYTLEIGSSGCAPAGSSTVKTVTVTNTLLPANITAPNTICNGSNVTMSSLTNGGTYSWNGPNSYTASTQNAAVNNWSSANNGTYTLIINYGPGCATTPATVNLTGSASPNIGVTISPSATLCAGQTVTLTASGGTGNNAYTWNWNIFQTSMSLESFFIFSCAANPLNSAFPGLPSCNRAVATPSANTQICVATTNAAGCTSQTCVPIVVASAGSLSVSASTSVCPGQSTTLSVSGGTSYTWSPAAGLSSVSGATVTATPTVSTIYTVTGQTCGSTVTRTVEVALSNNLLVNVNSASICPNQTATLTASGANTYTWSTSANTNSITVNPTSQTVYTVTGELGSCSGSQTATVTIVPEPTVIVSSATICAGQTATLTASGATNFTWSPGGELTADIIVTPSVTTSYTVLGSDGFCSSQSTGSVVANPNPTITVNSATICAGQSVSLTANGASSYTWSSGQNTAGATLTPTSTTSYTVIGSDAGCESLTTTTISVNPAPSISFTADRTSACGSLCVNFNDVVSSSCETISYNFGDGTSGSSNDPNHCYASVGVYTVSAICTNNTLGCSTGFTLSTPITVNTQPTANFDISGGSVVIVGNTVNFTNQSTNNTSSAWLTTCPQNTLTTTDISTTASDTGNCCVTLIAINNTCFDTISKCYTVVEEPTIVIPNVFTPNNDNSNDVFKITGSGLKTLNCVIYDRWGLKMYEWDGVSGGWNGNVKSGAAAPAGTYFYILDYSDLKDKTFQTKGFISLFRE
jgi:gliding motility-associated-like protein